MNSFKFEFNYKDAREVFPSRKPKWDETFVTKVDNNRIIITQQHSNCEWSKNKNRHWPIKKEIYYTSDLYRRGVEKPIKNIVHDCRGNWQIKVLSELFNAKEFESNVLLKIRLDKRCKCILLEKKSTHLLYVRKIKNVILDYCAVVDGCTYHHEDKQKAILMATIKSDASKTFNDKRYISMQDALELGFCQSGIISFVEDIGLNAFTDDDLIDTEFVISRAELEQKILSKRRVCKVKYEDELKKLGFTL